MQAMQRLQSPPGVPQAALQQQAGRQGVRCSLHGARRSGSSSSSSSSSRARAALPPTAAAPDSVTSAPDRLSQQPSSSGSGHAPPPSLVGRLARFAARKQQARSVSEADRPLAEYMALPASQYSVLDARKIERIDDATFRCYVGRLAFLGFAVEPVITVSVLVEPGQGCTIKLLSAQLQGSPVVEDLNSRFAARMTNVVRWADTGSPTTKQLASDTDIEVTVSVPGWAGLLPTGSIEAAGSRVMQTTLNLMVPRFLEQLERDYARWAAGDTSRAPLDDAAL